MGKEKHFIMDTLQDLVKQLDCSLVLTTNLFADVFRPIVVSIIVSQ